MFMQCKTKLFATVYWRFLVISLSQLNSPALAQQANGILEYDPDAPLITLAKLQTSSNTEFENVTLLNRRRLLKKLMKHAVKYYANYTNADSDAEKVALALKHIDFYRQIDEVKIIEVKVSGNSSSQKRYEIYSNHPLIWLIPLLYRGDTDEQLKLLLKALNVGKN